MSEKLFENLSNATIAYGVIFGLAGFAIQLLVRKEWPRGRLNEGSPQTLDPTKFATALGTAIAVGIAAAILLLGWHAPGTCKVPPPAEGDACSKMVQIDWIYAITIMVFGYVGADLIQILERLKNLFTEIKDKLAALLPGGAQRRDSRM